MSTPLETPPRSVLACVHQPNYLPWLGFFAKIVQSQIYIVMDNVQLPDASFVNRVRIAGAVDPTWITVPVKHPTSRDGPIREIRIDYSSNWIRKHLAGFQHRYGRAPAFKEIYAGLVPVLESRPELLADLNLALIRTVLAACRIETRIVLGSTLGGTGQASALIIDMCKKVGATSYLAGKGAVAYDDLELYKSNDMQYIRAGFRHPTYKQHGTTNFIEGLSVIDALFSIGPDATRALIIGGAGVTEDGR